MVENSIFEIPRSIQTSNIFFKKLEIKLSDCGLNGYYSTFNNCREYGFVLTIYSKKNNIDKELNIWACECRNSDNIMIVLGGNNDIDINKMFSDDAYKKAKYFSYNDYDSAINYVYKQIKYMFDITKNIHYSFNSYKSIEDIQRIELDAKDYDYDDFNELATFSNSDYFCDLIILNGKMGLRFSKYTSTDHNDFDNLSFIEFHPNLNDEVSLMMDMKKQLDKFIADELDYSIYMDIDVKI